jgi:serine/threonine protein kinase
MKQLLEGLAYIHRNKIIHRDIKGANLLVSGDGVLKIADWGLGHTYVPGRKNTNRVVTLWYRLVPVLSQFCFMAKFRAPEILLGEPRYGPPIDVWAAGYSSVYQRCVSQLWLHLSGCALVPFAFSCVRNNVLVDVFSRNC